MFGEKLFPGVGYPTPVSIPEDTSCLVLQIPADDEWWSVVVGLLYGLILEWNWQQFEGGLDRDVVAARWQQMLEDALEVAETTNSCNVPANVPTPYWDEDTDVDDEATPEMQTWYGTVSDPEAIPAELDFVENAAIWAFTGFLALATWEIGAAPAILFHTIAPEFVLAVRRGNLGEIIRILVDGEDAATVDTSSMAEGEVFYQAISADPALESHDLMLVQVS
jgi:hypothetical protein